MIAHGGRLQTRLKCHSENGLTWTFTDAYDGLFE
jgi:hypothetical protein